MICHLNFRQHTWKEAQRNTAKSASKLYKNRKGHTITLRLSSLHNAIQPYVPTAMVRYGDDDDDNADEQRLMYNVDAVELLSFHAGLHIKILLQVLKLSYRGNI